MEQIAEGIPYVPHASEVDPAEQPSNVDQPNLSQLMAQEDSDCDFYEKLLNVFITYHNTTSKTVKNMFEGVDYGEVASTTFSMEKFFELMTLYRNNQEHYPNRLDIVPASNEAIVATLKDAEDLYQLNIDNDVHSYCQDLFAILIYIASNENINSKKWDVMSVR